MVPVEGAEDGEVVVARARVRDVADQGVDPVAVLCQPGCVHGADD